MKYYHVFGYNVIINIAPKNTVWWMQPAHNKIFVRQRVDMLFSINRVFIRDFKRYIYEINIGRFRLLFTKVSP